MAKNIFTNEEINEFLKNNSISGKVTITDLGKIVFDTNFPAELFENAKNEIIQVRDDSKRHSKLADLISKKLKLAIPIQEKIIILKKIELKTMIQFAI